MNRREVFTAAIAACVASQELIGPQTLSEASIEAWCKALAASMTQTKEVLAANLYTMGWVAVKHTITKEKIESRFIDRHEWFLDDTGLT